MRLSRKSSLKGCCRELPGGARQQRRVRRSSFCEQCVEAAVGTTGATVISLRLFKPKKDPAVRPDQSRVVPRSVTSLFTGAFFVLLLLRSQQGTFREECVKQSGNTYFLRPCM